MQCYLLDYTVDLTMLEGGVEFLFGNMVQPSHFRSNLLLFEIVTVALSYVLFIISRHYEQSCWKSYERHQTHILKKCRWSSVIIEQ